jgi:hypothetical protein
VGYLECQSGLLPGSSLFIEICFNPADMFLPQKLPKASYRVPFRVHSNIFRYTERGACRDMIVLKKLKAV